MESLRKYPGARDEELGLLLPYLGQPEGTILDYACGDGFVTDRILQMWPEAEIWGVDLSETMLRGYRERFQAVPGVRGMSLNDFERTADQGFGLSVCLGALHHIQDQVAAISRIRARMRSGGRLVFADFEDGTASQRYFDGFIHRYNPGGHVGFFVSESRAVNLARACGLQLEAYRRVCIRWRFTAEADALGFVIRHHGLSCDALTTREQLQRERMLVGGGTEWGVEHHYAVVVFRAGGGIET